MDPRDFDDFMRRTVANLNALERRVTDLEQIEPDTVHLLSYRTLMSYLMLLPGLRGLWGNSLDDNGAVYDFSGQGRTLTGSGTPLAAQDGLIPCWDFDGTNYFYRADESGLDITGAEAYIDSAYQGLTVGGFFNYDTIATANDQGAIGKYQPSANQRSYNLYKRTTGTAQAIISQNGIATGASVNNGITLEAGAWYLLMLRFKPNTSLDIITNNAISSDTSSVPAAIHSGTADLNLMTYDNGAAIRNADGKTALAFLCCEYLSNEITQAIYDLSKDLFELEDLS